MAKSDDDLDVRTALVELQQAESALARFESRAGEPAQHCSFCRRSSREVGALVATSSATVRICKDCAAEALALLAQSEPPESGHPA